MGICKTEINLRRLIAAAPQQQNQANLIHYVATMRELLEQLAAETTPEGLPRVSKPKVNDYSEKIESIASKLAVPSDDAEVQEPFTETSIEERPLKSEESSFISSSSGLRKRTVLTSIKDRTHDDTGYLATPIKLDSAAQAHIQKHRLLQEDLIDEMVGLARQLKESSLMMSRSLQNTRKYSIPLKRHLE